MPVAASFDIWILEDNYRDLIDYYLEPLEEIAASKKGLSDIFEFPKIKVILLGLDHNQRSDYLDLSEQIEAGTAFSITRPHLYSNVDYEKNSRSFFRGVNGQIKDEDVVLIDPSLRGLGWEQPPGYVNFLLYVFEEYRNRKPPLYQNRVLLVSHVAKLITVSSFDKARDLLIPKLPNDKLNYRNKLSEVLESFLRPSDDWTNLISNEGLEKLAPYVEELRKTQEGRSALSMNIGECAGYALLQLLTPRTDCANDIIAATNGKHYWNPFDRRQRSSPSETIDKRLYMILIRRRIIYGLRRIWDEHHASKGSKLATKEDGLKSSSLSVNEDDYKLWLEVVAAGYRWYGNEMEAIGSIIRAMKNSQLSLTRENTIDLEDIDSQFSAKNNCVVKTVRLQPQSRGIRKQAGRYGLVRFFEGKLSFVIRGEQVRDESNEMSAKSHYEIIFDNAKIKVPADSTQGTLWDEFWRQAKYPEDFSLLRHGHVEKMQKELVQRPCFKDVTAMLSFNTALSEEKDWWNRFQPTVRQWLLNVGRDGDGFDPFSPLDQCEQHG